MSDPKMTNDDIDVFMLNYTLGWPQAMKEGEVEFWTSRLVDLNFEVAYEALEEFLHSEREFRPPYPMFWNAYNRNMFRKADRQRQKFANERGLGQDSGDKVFLNPGGSPTQRQKEINRIGRAKGREAIANLPRTSWLHQGVTLFAEPKVKSKR
jgi:hypothetical protein